jgi:hypothetical protein
VLLSWFSGCCSRACSHLADRPRGGCGPSAWRFLPRCSSRSSRVLERRRFDPVGYWLLVESGLADSPQGCRGQSARHELLADRPRTWYGPSAHGGAGWVVLLVFNGPSAWTAAEQLSPLLLGSCFRFGIIWGLFLGLVRLS